MNHYFLVKFFVRKETEDEETTLGYQSKELFLLGGAIRNGNVGMEVVQNALLNRASLLATLGHFDEAVSDCQGVKIENEDVNRQCQVQKLKIFLYFCSIFQEKNAIILFFTHLTNTKNAKNYS